jgi:ATP synthase protein I
MQLGKAVRRAVLWQALATLLIAAVSGWVAGPRGVISAVLGGAISLLAGVASAWLAARSKTGSPGEALYGVLRAEGVRIVLMLGLLLLVLLVYKQVVALSLIGSFIVSALLFTFAVFTQVQ